MSDQQKNSELNKLIECHIKDMLFNKKTPDESPQSQITPDLNYNRSPYRFSEKPFLPTTEKTQHIDKSVSSLPIDCSFNKEPCSSQLIDLNVLTNFAAKHADINDISDAPRNIPHPELEDALQPSPDTRTPVNTALKYHSLQGSKSPPKTPYSTGTGDKNSIRLDNFNDSERVSPDKRKRRKPRNRPRDKEKFNHKVQGNDELAKQSTTPIRRESVKQDRGKVNKQHSVQKEVPKTPEKRKEIMQHGSDTHSQSRIPMPSGELEYTLTLGKDGYKFTCNICNYDARNRDYIHKHFNSENHKEQKKQVQSDRMLAFLPKPLPAQIEAIEELLKKVYAEHGLSEEDLLVRQKVAERLTDYIKAHLTDCSVEMTGSSVTGLGLKDSKVDFALKVGQEKDIPDALELLYKKLLSDPTYCDVVSVFKKKRLGIMFTDKETGLECSLVLENAVTEKFSKVFSMYAELDPRVKILASCFRYWAKICLLDNQDRGTLPPYTYSILLVYFLQQIETPVLPVLHEVKSFSHVDFVEKYIKAKVWKSENTCSIGELWIQLFYFYNFTYEMGKHVVCIRHSEKVLCSDKMWSTKFYAIEDPFSRRNIAHVIPNYPVAQYIQHCFMKTYRYFAIPRTKEGEIQILKSDGFEERLRFFLDSKNEATEDLCDDSDASDNDDSSIPDESSFLQEFEDQDPDIPIEDVISAVKQMQLDENIVDDGEIFEDLTDQNSSPQLSPSKSDSPKKDSRKNKEKVVKVDERDQVRETCAWDLRNHRDLTVDSFIYQMDSRFFKDKKDIPSSCKNCKETGHLTKNCPNESLPVKIELPQMTDEFTRAINKALYYIKDKNCVEDVDKQAMLHKMKEIETYIQKLFPKATLRMFGSFCNGFGFKVRSDMDFCLTFTDQEDRKHLDCSDVIEKLAKHLREYPRLENIVPVTSAKVPIVKFSCIETGLEGDISLYNTLALANTEMLEMYSRIDPRVQILGFALKYFAKTLGICDASRGSLSSYAYILMVIFFLQQRQPPVIPVLQELHGKEKPSQIIEDCNVWYFKDTDKVVLYTSVKIVCENVPLPPGLLSMCFELGHTLLKERYMQYPEIWSDYGKNKESVAELWLALLSFYAYDFDWQEYVVSIKQKTLLTRFRKMWMTDQIAIEDPFDLTHNLGAGLSRKMNMYILKTFIRGRERFGMTLPSSELSGIYGREVAYFFDRRFLNSGVDPPHDRGCRKCGKIGHLAKNCPQEKLCSYCRKPGHIQRNCPWRNKAKMKPKQHSERNMKEPFPSESKNNMDMQNLQGHSLRAHGGCDVQRTNNQAHPLLSMNSDDRDISRKLLQMGFPSHRHPPPGFVKQAMMGPPPGFKAMHDNNTKFRFPNCPAPFPRMNNLSQSPPKPYSCSPPKNFMGGNVYHPERMPPMGVRHEVPMSPSDPMHQRMWQGQLNSRMPMQFSDRRKRTN